MSVYSIEADMQSHVGRATRLIREEIRRSAVPTELAYALELVAPAVAYGASDWYRHGRPRSQRDDQEWMRKLRLDWEAGHHHGGYHGYSFDQIEEQAAWYASACVED